MPIAPVNAKQSPRKSVEARKTAPTALRLPRRIYIGPALLLSATSTTTERTEADLLASPRKLFGILLGLGCDWFLFWCNYSQWGSPGKSNDPRWFCFSTGHAVIYISGARFVYQ